MTTGRSVSGAARVFCAAMLVSVIGASVTACSDSSGQSRGESHRATKVVELGDGARVIFADAPAHGSELVVRTSSPPPMEEGYVALSQPREFTMRKGSLGRGATIEFPVSKDVTASSGTDSTVAITTFDELAGRWVSVPTELDRRAGVARTFSTHFSWWALAHVDLASVGARINQRVGELVGKRAPAATCTRGQPTPAWVAQLVGISNDGAIAVRACVEGEGDTLAIEMRNNRPYGMVLTYGGPVRWGWHEPGNTGVDFARNAIADALMQPNQLFLPPLSRASVGIPRLSGYQQFAAMPSAGSLMLDLGTMVAADLLAAAGTKVAGAVIGACGGYIASAVPFDQLDSPGEARTAILDAGGCLRAAFVALAKSGAVDQMRVTALQGSLDALSKANQVGWVLKAYDVEWRVLDLFVDTKLAGPVVGLGAGFGVRARSESVETPAPPTASPPTPPPATASPAPRTTPTTPPTTSAPPARSTWTEQQGTRGANTFADPYRASGYGPRVDPWAYVEVSCKVYAPNAVASANPDGYWYRIASAPWNNQFYAVANTFWNGDVPNQTPYTHNTDWAVPDC